MPDFSKVSIDDEFMTIEQMLQNPHNWPFAAQVIQSPAELVPRWKWPELAAKFPAFWLRYMAQIEGHG